MDPLWKWVERLEDAAYIKQVQRLGLRAVVLADVVRHTGGPYYGQKPPEKVLYWRRFAQKGAS